MSKSKSSIDFKFTDGSKIFFTSDTHFSHANIMKYCNRPFSTVEEMNETMIANWNRVVPEDGIVFHLGDFAFGGFPVWESVRARLNGKIILVIGNHDMKQNLQNTVRLEKMFEHMAFQMKVEIEGQKIYLNHFPFLCYSGSWRKGESLVWQLFGHVHSGRANSAGLDTPRLVYLFPSQYDVGVDGNGFAPVSFYQIKEIISKQLEDHLRKATEFGSIAKSAGIEVAD